MYEIAETEDKEEIIISADNTLDLIMGINTDILQNYYPKNTPFILDNKIYQKLIKSDKKISKYLIYSSSNLINLLNLCNRIDYVKFGKIFMIGNQYAQVIIIQEILSANTINNIQLP